MNVRGAIAYTKVRRIGIGEGLNSEVYLIEDPQLGGQLVAKEIPKVSFRDPSEYFEEAQRLFAAQHRNVVPIHYACTTASHISLVMPYYARGSLGAQIEEGPLIERDAIRIALEVLRGLKHIHSRNLVHFDLKPSNVLFNDTGTPMVADFGQSRAMSRLGFVNPIPPLYVPCAPPEAYTMVVGSIKADVYHAGLLLYRMVNGDPMFTADMPDDLAASVKTGRFPDRKRFLPHVTPRLRTIIRKALKVDLKKRYDSVDEIEKDLGRVKPTDWEVDLTADQTRWFWDREGEHADVIVEQSHLAGGVSVDVYTALKSGTRRAKRPADFRLRGASSEGAWKHLNDVVFPALRQ
ncbi:MAG: serine/threonine-protein kinase [Polyangiaceae bacterium]